MEIKATTNVTAIVSKLVLVNRTMNIAIINTKSSKANTIVTENGKNNNCIDRGKATINVDDRQRA